MKTPLSPTAQRLPRALSMACLCAMLLAGCITGAAPKTIQFADLGTHRLAYIAQGAGTPTVVFLSGLDSKLTVWQKVQPEVAKFTKTIAYDRGGVGWSDNSPEPRDGLTIARELHAFLEKAGCAPPYLLCAHSMGGLYARLFAANYRDEVAGLVLIDATSEDLAILQAHLLSRGVVRAIENAERPMRNSPLRYGVSGEWFNRNKTFDEVRAQAKLPDVPLVYLGQDVGKRMQHGKAAPSKKANYARDLALAQTKLVPNGKYEVVPGTGHNIHLQRPDVVVRTIKDMIDSRRK